MPKAVLIVHPRADRYKLYRPLLEHLCETFDLRIEQSTFAGETREHARRLMPNFQGVFFTAGGDGTLHEAINGWADAGFPKGPRFCPLPLGTGNDFLYSIHPKFASIETYLTQPLGLERSSDLGRVFYQNGPDQDSRYFCVGATTGFSAIVTERRAALAKHIPGQLSYLMALFLSFAFWKNRTIQIESRETPHQSDTFFNFNAANVRHYGGGMVSAPDADPFDGTLNAVSMNLTLLQAIRALPENFKGRFERVSNVFRQGLREPFEVSCCPACPVQADGEMLGQTPMRVECYPAKLPLLLPGSRDRVGLLG